jgi:hypothetical protein
MLTFLTVLLGIALGLSAASPRAYRTLRYVALGLHMFVAGLWMLADGQTHWLLALIFMSIWWVMLLAETTLAAIRRQSSLGNPVSVLIATAGYVTAGTWILDSAVPAGPDWLGLYTAGIAIIGAATALQFGPGLDGLRNPPRLPIDRQAVALWVQSGVLLIVAAALQFDGYGRSIAWLALAAASIELGRHLRSRGLDVFGIIVGSLALLMVITVDALFSTALAQDVWNLDAGRFGVHIDQWSLLCLGTIIVIMYAAQRLRAGPQDGWQPMPVILATVATLCWLGLCLARGDGLAIATGWAIGGGLLLIIDPINRNVRTNGIATGVLLLTASWWAVVDVLAYRNEWTAAWPEIDATPVLNSQFAVGVLIAGLLGVVYRIRTKRLWPDIAQLAAQPQRILSVTTILPVAAALILTSGLAMELERVLSQIERDVQTPIAWPPVLWRMLWITMFMALASVVMMVAGRHRRQRPMLVCGSALATIGALLWLSSETLVQLAQYGIADVQPVLNIQFGAGLACALAMLSAWKMLMAGATPMMDEQETSQQRGDRRSAIFALAIAGAVGLWLGSFEIARIMQPDRMAMQMGLSVYWGIYAVALIVLGFVRRVPAARYVGLALLGLTVIKVLSIDLATVEQIWRIVSLLVTGVLAIGVSVGYARIAPRLRNADAKSRPQA